MAEKPRPDSAAAPRSLAEFFDSVVGSEDERAYAAGVLRDLKTLQRALAFYADPENWTADDWGVHAVMRGREYGDAGRAARRTAPALRRLLG